MSTRALRPPAWTELAVCAEVDPDLHFPAKGEPVEPAKVLCRSCEVRLPCLAFALARYEDYGIWGGFSAEGRQHVRRQLRAGRSLAAIVAGDDAGYYERAESAAERAEAALARQRERYRAKAAEARQAIAGTIPEPREQAA